MGKAKRGRVLKENEVRAVLRMVRTSPRKLNLVAEMIRGKKVAAALADLEFSRKRIAVQVRKTLQSAIANAENNHDLDVDNLVVTEASVGRNLVMKRFHARARGRGARIEKPFSQVTIVVEEKREEKKPEPKAQAPKSGGGKKKQAASGRAQTKSKETA
jgi:large subunit ribosomal protein L22